MEQDAREFIGEDGFIRYPVLDGVKQEDLVSELGGESSNEIDTGDNGVPVYGGNMPMPIEFAPVATLADRDEAVKEYWQDREHYLQALEDGDCLKLIDGIVKEMSTESDRLLANESVASKNNDIQSSTVIIAKRVDTLKEIVRTISQKHYLARDMDLDLDHPQMQTVFEWMFDKITRVIQRLELPAEQHELFFTMLGEATQNWKHDIRMRMGGVREQNVPAAEPRKRPVELKVIGVEDDEDTTDE